MCVGVGEAGDSAGMQMHRYEEATRDDILPPLCVFLLVCMEHS